MRWMAPLLLLAMLVAGCSDPPAEQAPDGTADADVDETTGAISGVVVDPTIFPVEGAMITLTGHGMEATSNERGQFVFEGLEPGIYVLEVRAPGHLSIQSSADVAAGKVSKPRIVLPIDTSPVPYPLTTYFEGYIEAADAYAVWILMDFIGNTELCTCEFNATIGPGAHTAILEAMWDPSSQTNDPALWYDVYPPGGGDYWGSSEAPMYVTRDAKDWMEGEARIVFSVASTVSVQQSFDAFFTVWYDGAPPDGWSVVEGSG